MFQSGKVILREEDNPNVFCDACILAQSSFAYLFSSWVIHEKYFPMHFLPLHGVEINYFIDESHVMSCENY